VAWDKHLLIDGYNILHAWDDVRPVLRDGVATARTRLCEKVRVIHDCEAVRVTVVFDGRGSQTEIERPTEETTFSLLFAPADLTADGLIEQFVLASKKPQSLYVATRDNAIGNAVRASEAVLLSPDALREWVDSCERLQAQEVARRQREARTAWKKGTPWK